MKIVFISFLFSFSLTTVVLGADFGGARARFDTDWLKFHNAKDSEQEEFHKYRPKLPKLERPDKLEQVSEKFTVEMAMSKDNKKSETLDGIILLYDADFTEQTEDMEHADVYQILLRKSNGKVVFNESVRDSKDFRLFNIDTPQGKDVVIRSVEWNPKNSRELTSHVRQLNAKVDRYDTLNLEGPIGILGTEGSTEQYTIVDSENTVALGKPRAGEGPYGLYRATDKGLELIREFSETLPGFKGSYLDRLGHEEEFFPISHSIVGAFATGKESFVVINDMKGLVAVSLHNRNNDKRLFKVENEKGTFAVVLEWANKPKPSQCLDLPIGVYRNDQPNGFYGSGETIGKEIRYPGNTKAELPFEVWKLGLNPHHSGLEVLPSGCGSE